MASLNDPKPSTAAVHEQQRRFSGERSLADAAANLHVALTYEPLNAASCMARVKSPKAGAVVLFAGTLFQISSQSASPFHQHTLANEEPSREFPTRSLAVYRSRSRVEDSSIKIGTSTYWQITIARWGVCIRLLRKFVTDEYWNRSIHTSR
jgi:hypothetical protein